ncbi:hypothetical protein GCM10010168_93690 [Actinoplanes ianthinogenes]|nr:hypothetical protein GCM10010168_93690 [Actinoplanes ianthinogenes]
MSSIVGKQNENMDYSLNMSMHVLFFKDLTSKVHKFNMHT